MKLEPAQKRTLYQLCWQYEDAWIQDSRITPESWLAKAWLEHTDSIDSKIVLAELTDTHNELEMRARSERQLSPAEAERYEFVEEIARGGAAAIWRVKDHHLQRQSAVKYLMDSQDNRIMRSRLRREARICAKLVHPGIVPIHELSSFADGRPFVCMKLIEGKTLLQLLKATPTTSFDSLLDTFTKACQAIAFAHDQSIIHRDLTPSNIMVGPFGEVQIMDWGLAKDLTRDTLDSDDDSEALPSQVESSFLHLGHSDLTTIAVDGEKTRVGSVFGTIAYLSPEQASGRVDQIDKRSDVFSLGAILCRLLTGTPPYQKSNQEELLLEAQTANLDGAIQRLSKTKNRMLSELAIRCMSVDRNSRPKDASAIVAELDRIRVTKQRHRAALRNSILAIGFLAIVSYSIYRSSSTGNNRQVIAATAPNNIEPENEEFKPVTDREVIHSLLNAGQIEFVLKSHRAALESHPNDEALHFLICSALMNAFRYEEAEILARKVVQMSPGYAAHHILLSDAQFFRGQFADSVASMESAKLIRDAGDSTPLPIDEKLAKRKKLLGVSMQLTSSNDFFDCDPADYLDFAQVCQIMDKFELATVYYNKVLAHEADLVNRSYTRFHLLIRFPRSTLLRSELTASQRRYLQEVALDWLSQQLEFAMQDTAKDAEASGPQTAVRFAENKKDLLKDLKEREGMKTIKAVISDPRTETTLKSRYESLMSQIHNAN